MASHIIQQTDMPNLIYRLKLRLALANFKREHGYENVDLRTLESSLYEHKFNKSLPNVLEESDLAHNTKRRKITSEHPIFPFTSPPSMHRDMSHSFKHTLPGNIPASETRFQYAYDQRKISLSSDDEDAAHLLVLMHQSPTMSS
ncbi:hypothetical protein BD560DRAFT_413629 [Blakeslea trispora]|nr:hypothetical protein BD560DRAFT_413629 [Blakeslea trispora]